MSEECEAFSSCKEIDPLVEAAHIIIERASCTEGLPESVLEELDEVWTAINKAKLSILAIID